MELKENEKINKENIKYFKRYVIHDSEVFRYKCVLCEKEVCVSNSASNQGDRLICMNCYYEKFDRRTFDARKWINREN